MEMTITKLARQIGISQGFLSNICLGRRRPHYKVAKKIAAVTQTDPVLWLEGTPEEIKNALSENREIA